MKTYCRIYLRSRCLLRHLHFLIQLAPIQDEPPRMLTIDSSMVLHRLLMCDQWLYLLHQHEHHRWHYRLQHSHRSLVIFSSFAIINFH